MQIIKFISDERGVSESVFKLALVVIIFAGVIALIVAVIKPLMDSQEEAGDTMKEARDTHINKALDQASED